MFPEFVCIFSKKNATPIKKCARPTIKCVSTQGVVPRAFSQPPQLCSQVDSIMRLFCPPRSVGRTRLGLFKIENSIFFRNMTSHIFLNPNFDVIHRKSLNSLRPAPSGRRSSTYGRPWVKPPAGSGLSLMDCSVRKRRSASTVLSTCSKQLRRRWDGGEIAVRRVKPPRFERWDFSGCDSTSAGHLTEMVIETWTTFICKKPNPGWTK